jgi:ankyrin repeat protein
VPARPVIGITLSGYEVSVVDVARFSEAVWSGDLSAVEEMIVAGVDVNGKSADAQWPPLHLAIEQRHHEIVRRLIAAGASLNLDADGSGWTPLVHAIDIESDAAWQMYHEPDREFTELTEMLLAAGAIPTKRAFEIATDYQNRKALALLNRFAGHAAAG